MNIQFNIPENNLTIEYNQPMIFKTLNLDCYVIITINRDNTINIIHQNFQTEQLKFKNFPQAINYIYDNRKYQFIKIVEKVIVE